jgi:hypothetical protein
MSAASLPPSVIDALEAASAGGADLRQSPQWASLSAREKKAALSALSARRAAASAADDGGERTAAAAGKKRGRGAAAAAAPGAAAGAGFFVPETCRIMHAFADSSEPDAGAAALVEAYAIAFARTTLATLRVVVGKDRTTVRVKDFVAYLPSTTRVFFRWKVLKGLSATAAGDGDAGGSGGESDGIDGGPAGDDDDGDFAEAQAQLSALESAVDDGVVVVVDDAGRKGGGDVGSVAGCAASVGGVDPPPAAATATLVTGDGDAGGDGAVIVAPLTLPRADEDPTLAVFYARLAYANARSGGMSPEQYDAYAHAREASFFKGAHGRKAFVAAVGGGDASLKKIVYEVLAFIAYAAAADVIEGAAKHAFGALPAAVEVASAGETLRAIPRASYEAALRVADTCPVELAGRARAELAGAAARGQLEALKEARHAADLASGADRAHTATVEREWADGKANAEGDAELLAAIVGGGAAGAQAGAAAAPVGAGAQRMAGFQSYAFGRGKPGR